MSARSIQSTLESDVCRFIFSGFTTSTDLLLGFIPKEFQVRFQAFRCLIYKVQFLRLPLGKVLVYFTKVYFVCQELFSKFFDFLLPENHFSRNFSLGFAVQLVSLTIISQHTPCVNLFFNFLQSFLVLSSKFIFT